jgi:hypothetical protein
MAIGSFRLSSGGGGGTTTIPVVMDVATYQVDTTITSHDVTLPSDIISGDLLIMIWRAGGTTDVSTPPSGFTQLGTRNSNGITYIWYKIATGAEGGTITVTTAANTRATAITYKIRNAVNTPEIQVLNSNTNNPPSITASWGSADNLFIAWMTNRRSDSTVTGAPTDYVQLTTITQPSNTNLTRARISTAHRYVTGTTDDPSAFTTSGTIDNPHSGTIVIY